MSITIKEVTTQHELIKFIEFPNKLYRENKYYVPQLVSADLHILSKDKNSAFDFCEATYWLAYNGKSKIVGRIAGIINNKYNEKTRKRYVRFGWIDFVQEEKVLEALLKTVEEWAREHNGEVIHGPLGFSDMDVSGILVEGFEEIPTAYGKYNAPYYGPMLEKHGYSKEVDWVEYNVRVPKRIPEKYPKMAAFIEQRYNLKVLKFNKKKELLRYSDELFGLLNREYEKIYGFSELTPRQMQELKEQFIPLLQLRFVSVVVNADNKVVGFGICLPSLSRALQKARGKLFPFGFLHIKWALKFNDTLDTVLIAIHSDYKDKGINSLIFNSIGQAIMKDGITNIETTRELEENSNVQNLWNKFDYRKHKRARCYSKKL